VPRKLRRLSGTDVVRILGQFGFLRLSQRGSHVKLRRVLSTGGKQTLVVPLHDELDRGTLGALFKQASTFIPDEELAPHFFTE